jgi:hypothetical protein
MWRRRPTRIGVDRRERKEDTITGAPERGRICAPLPFSGPRADSSLMHSPHFGHPKAAPNLRRRRGRNAHERILASALLRLPRTSGCVVYGSASHTCGTCTDTRGGRAACYTGAGPAHSDTRAFRYLHFGGDCYARGHGHFCSDPNASGDSASSDPSTHGRASAHCYAGGRRAGRV